MGTTKARDKRITFWLINTWLILIISIFVCYTITSKTTNSQDYYEFYELKSPCEIINEKTGEPLMEWEERVELNFENHCSKYGLPYPQAIRNSWESLAEELGCIWNWGNCNCIKKSCPSDLKIMVVRE